MRPKIRLSYLILSYLFRIILDKIIFFRPLLFRVVMINETLVMNQPIWALRQNVIFFRKDSKEGMVIFAQQLSCTRIEDSFWFLFVHVMVSVALAMTEEWMKNTWDFVSFSTKWNDNCFWLENYFTAESCWKKCCTVLWILSKFWRQWYQAKKAHSNYSILSLL